MVRLFCVDLPHPAVLAVAASDVLCVPLAMLGKTRCEVILLVQPVRSAMEAAVFAARHRQWPAPNLVKPRNPKRHGH